MKKGTSAAVRTFIIASDLFMKSSVIDSMQNTLISWFLFSSNLQELQAITEFFLLKNKIFFGKRQKNIETEREKKVQHKL